MFARMPIAALVLSLLVSPLAAGDLSSSSQQTAPATTAQATQLVDTADTTLAKVKELAKSPRNFDQAFELIKSTFDRNVSHGDQSTQILNLLAPVLADAKEIRDIQFADEILSYASALIAANKTNRGLNGHESLDSAYPYMQSVSRFAELALGVDEETSARLSREVGTIARNLVVSPSFPTPAKRGIAWGLFVESRGHAMQGNHQLACDALRSAFQWGYVDFEAAFEDHVLQDLDMGGQFKSIITQARSVYQTAVKTRVQTALLNFPQYRAEFSLTGLDGNQVTPANYRERLLVMEIGATWCGPCRQSIPHLKRIQADFEERGVSVLNASFENDKTDEEKITRLKEFVAKEEIDYDVAIGNDQLKASIQNFQSFPTLVFVDGQGNVRYIASGYHDYTQVASIVELLLAPQFGTINY